MTLRAGRRVRDEVENEVEVGFEVGDEVEAQEIYLIISFEVENEVEADALKKFTLSWEELRAQSVRKKLLDNFFERRVCLRNLL